VIQIPWELKFRWWLQGVYCWWFGHDFYYDDANCCISKVCTRCPYCETVVDMIEEGLVEIS